MQAVYDEKTVDGSALVEQQNRKPGFGFPNGMPSQTVVIARFAS